MDKAAKDVCGAGLKRVCELADIPPVLHMGSCVDISRMMILASELAKDSGLEISQLPVVGCAPEWMSEKAVSIGNYVIATGIDTFLGVDPYVSGSSEMAALLTEGTRKWTGAAFTVETDIEKLVDLMIERIEGEKSDIKSSAFFHIPLTEQRDAWYEYMDNGFNDTENVKYVYGKAGESGKIVYSGMGEDNLFEAMQELGSTKAVFCGHDHYNNFSIEYKGIRFTYGMSIDYLAYSGISKVGTQRGCTVITFSPDGSFDCHAENYYQDKYLSPYEKESVTMQELTEKSTYKQD